MSRLPRVLAVTSAIPFREHSQPHVTAVHIVSWELLTALAAAGHDVRLQPMIEGDAALSEAEREELRQLDARGVPASEPIRWRKPALPGAGARALRTLSPVGPVAEFYPTVGYRGALNARVQELGAGALLTLWSPEGVAAGARASVPLVSYQGDIDFVPAEVRVADAELFGTGEASARGRRLRQRLWLSRFRSAHWRTMRDVACIANVTASNVGYYRARGHRRSSYVRNTWSDLGAGDPISMERSRPLRILGHVGGLGQTGSSYGLRYLLSELAPHLERELSGRRFEVHLIGGGELLPALRPLAGRSWLVRRGYVEDLDAEIRSSHAFLLLNNAGRYLAAYTRHVVAWSSGSCLVVHAGSRLAVPEIAPDENAVVAADPAEMAAGIRRAASDPEWNALLRRGGRATYEARFTPRVVATALADALAEAVENGAR